MPILCLTHILQDGFANFIPLPGPEEARSLSMPNILCIFPKNSSRVHFGAGVQE